MESAYKAKSIMGAEGRLFPNRGLWRLWAIVGGVVADDAETGSVLKHLTSIAKDNKKGPVGMKHRPSIRGRWVRRRLEPHPQFNFKRPGDGITSGE